MGRVQLPTDTLNTLKQQQKKLLLCSQVQKRFIIVTCGMSLVACHLWHATRGMSLVACCYIVTCDMMLYWKTQYFFLQHFSTLFKLVEYVSSTYIHLVQAFLCYLPCLNFNVVKLHITNSNVRFYNNIKMAVNCLSLSMVQRC